MRNKKIAIVDDDLSFLDYFEQLTQEQNYNIETFCNPVNALKHLLINNYDYVILDAYLPEISGLELAEHLIAQNRTQKIIIITNKRKSLKEQYQDKMEFIYRPQSGLYERVLSEIQRIS